jgi:hypothetical protein
LDCHRSEMVAPSELLQDAVFRNRRRMPQRSIPMRGMSQYAS